jgi:hypothetical protein
MRKFAHVAATAAGSLAVALMAGAFAAGPGARTAPAVPGGDSLARIRPGGPMTIAGNRPAAAGSFSTRTVNTVSGNWAGYVAGRPGVKFRYVRAVFFVPYLDCASTPSSFSGHWIGLDGAGDSTVEQDGILAACQGTTPQYSAWYEMFPLPPIYSTITVRPGNSIVASVYYDSGARTFTMSLTDTTNGENFSHTQACPEGADCQRMSAEAISEAPSSGASILPLTNFRAESFSNVVVTDSQGARSGLRGPGWDTMSVTTETLHQHQAVVLDQPTQIFRGRSFDCYWMAAS